MGDTNTAPPEGDSGVHGRICIPADFLLDEVVLVPRISLTGHLHISDVALWQTDDFKPDLLSLLWLFIEVLCFH